MNRERPMGEDRRLSRRGLMQSAGVGLAAGVMAGAGSALAPRVADAAPVEVPASWDREADVVVVGGGGAGTAAAIEAARAGADVLLLERAENLGGNTAHSGGIVYLGGGTALQKRHGFEDTPENMYAYLEAQMGPTADKERIRIYCERSVEHHDWLVNEGLEFGEKFWPGKVVQPPAEEGGLSFSGNEANYPFSEIAEPMPRGHMPPGAGATVYATLKRAFDGSGATAEVNAGVERLVTTADGRVVGVVANLGGQQAYVLARKGVVLTTGGFQFNQEMLAIHAPWYLAGVPLGGPHQGDDGSGIKMAQAVGAATFDMAFGSPWKFVYGPDAMCKSVLVDNRGARFVNEAAYGQDVGDPILRRNDGVAWLIMDQQIADEVTAAGRTLGDPTFTAETIDALAEQLEVSVDVLTNTLTFYNEQAAKGEDPLFHKKAEFLQPLAAPYLVFDFGAVTGIPFITLGGLRADTETRVLDAFGEPIPGLYAAGRTAPGISPEYYVSGSAVGDCTFWGRVAGKAVAAAESWSS